jgi:hypothetical protein
MGTVGSFKKTEEPGPIADEILHRFPKVAVWQEALLARAESSARPASICPQTDGSGTSTTGARRLTPTIKSFDCDDHPAFTDLFRIWKWKEPVSGSIGNKPFFGRSIFIDARKENPRFGLSSAKNP